MEDYSCCTSLRDVIKYTQEKEIEREAKKVQHLVGFKAMAS